MKKKVLLTGASGFIGANLLRRLIVQNYDVHILVRKSSNLWRISNIIKKISVHEIEYTNLDAIKSVVQKIHPQIIYNLVTFGGYPFQTDVQTIVEANIIATVNLLIALNPVAYEIFITTGSSSEYGYNNTPMNEDDITKPVSIYAATKLGMTHIALAFAKTMKKPVTVIRPFSVYGPYEEPSRLIPTVILKSLKNSDIALTYGDDKRDFIYIEDFLDGLERIVQKVAYTKGQIINLGSGIQHSTREVVTIIRELTQSISALQWGTYTNRKWDTLCWVADISKAKKLTGWKPKHSLRQGLSKTFTWFRTHRRLYEKEI